MTTVTHTCDGCGATRGETNHWFAVEIKERGTILPVMTITAFLDSSPSAEHFCGESCLIKRISVYLADVKKRYEQIILANGADELPVLDEAGV